MGHPVLCAAAMCHPRTGAANAAGDGFDETARARE